MTTATGFFLGAAAASSQVQWIPLLHTMLGTMLVASGAAALNQWSERQFDARMRRTARRPVAAGRIEPVNALAFGGVLSLAGAAYLAIVVSGLASAARSGHAADLLVRVHALETRHVAVYD